MEENVCKLKLKYHEIEFEAEGNEEYIAKERSVFQETLNKAIELLSNNFYSIQDKTVNVDLIESNNFSEPKLLKCTCEPSKYVNFGHFIKDKGFNTDVDRIAAATCYLGKYMNKDLFTKEDIETELKNAKFPLPKNISDVIAKNIRKLNIDEVFSESEKIDGKRTFRLLEQGIEYCENYIPKETKNKTKNTKSIVKSELCEIPLDELNIEKYGDLSNLKPIEIVPVIMHMYTNEKGIEYFSNNDLLCIIKDKFKISITKRQIAYVFEKSGTKFDSIMVNGKQAKHKLLQNGIKEAEEIIRKTVLVG